MAKEESVYELLEEDKDNFKKSKIVRKNLTNEFTLESVEKYYNEVKKKLKESEAQAELSAAEMVNIKEHHPFVLDFDEMQIHTLEMYIKSLRTLQKVEPIIQELKELKGTYEEEMDEIYKQCNFKRDMEEEKKEEVVEEVVEEAAEEEAPEAE